MRAARISETRSARGWRSKPRTTRAHITPQSIQKANLARRWSRRAESDYVDVTGCEAGPRRLCRSRHSEASGRPRKECSRRPPIWSFKRLPPCAMKSNAWTARTFVARAAQRSRRMKVKTVMMRMKSGSGRGPVAAMEEDGRRAARGCLVPTSPRRRAVGGSPNQQSAGPWGFTPRRGRRISATYRDQRLGYR